MTEHIELEDESGYTLKLLQLNNGRFAGPTFNSHTLNNSKSIRLRDDDILFCSYGKSGCHWLWQNVRLLLQEEVTLDDVDKESAMLDVLSLEELDRLPSPRLINTHIFFDMLPLDVLKGKVKIVFVYRNPKDIAVSYYHHHRRLKYYSYKGQFSDYIKRFVKGNVSGNDVFEYWRGWEEGLRENPQIPCHVVSFEQVKMNPLIERRRLANFLGRSCSDDYLREVESSTEISVMRKTKVKDDDKDDQKVFYRRGIVGDWKNHFTVQENEWFDDIIQTKMADSKMFNFIYSMDK